jgi:transcriptional regulator PpsR
MVDFAAPGKTFAGLSAQTAARLIASSCDLALVLDSKEVIRDLSVRSETLRTQLGASEKWIGKRWADLVTSESRPKLALLLREAAVDPDPKWRHVNYPAAKGADVPVLHAAVALPESGRIVVFGRDLRPISILQQRLADAQFSLERDLTRVRNAEARYRLLFQASPDAIFIVEGANGRVVDSNPAAAAIFGAALKRGGTRGFAEMLAPASRKSVETAFAKVRASGREERIAAEPMGGKDPVTLSITIAGKDADSPLFVRALGGGTAPDGTGLPVAAIEALDTAPDGLVVAYPDGRLRHANRAFLEMAEIGSLEQAMGQPLDRWIGREGVDLDVLLANLRQRGHVRLFETVVRGERGKSQDVEVNAAMRGQGKEARFVLAMRASEGRIGGTRDTKRDAARSPEQLAELIGRVSLKDLVRESTDTIERMCIEAALELTRDNRASAAEMLGLSRQSLYVKLRRYGLAELGDVEND